MCEWAKEEAKTADFGDERLNNRFAIILDQLGSKPQLSIPTACVDGRRLLRLTVF